MGFDPRHQLLFDVEALHDGFDDPVAAIDLLEICVEAAE